MSDPLKNFHAGAKGFDFQVDAYEKARPSYPEEAISFLAHEIPFNSSNLRVLELGSGTGKFTRLLTPFIEDGSIKELVAIEPSAQMRQKLIEVVPKVVALEGTAERIPFENDTIDVVFAAQAFHWFATTAALQEIHRVLKPGGKFLCIWNLLDGSVDWVHQFRDLFEKYEKGHPQYRTNLWRKCFENDAGKLFRPAQEKRFKQTLKGRSFELIWEDLLSKSYMANMDKSQQEQVRLDVYDLLHNKLNIFDPQTKVVDVPYDTDLYWVSPNK
eukprot:TRINITY_DN7846_c0_g1_i1.p1 TRINITY_DN7846_c0_g1~~TRINITY_DN7846_c0_g1_i1.p1  ORF type:complete len:271 (-),score=31.72 TRINITY_DN7846_c0_g1_i1:22-834(-)